MLTEIINPTLTVFRYDSVSELLDRAPIDGPLGLGRGWNSPDFVGRSFRSWREVSETASECWSDGIAVVEDMLSQLADCELPRPVSRRRVQRWSDDGDTLDLDRLEQDLPAWRGTYRAQRSGPQTVTLVSAMTTPGSYDWQEVLWRGAAMLATATLLEQAGYSVELYAANYIVPHDRDKELRIVPLKEAGDSLNMSSLVSILSGWAYRTAWLATGHGTCKSLPANLLPEGAHLIENVFSMEDAIESVRRVIGMLIEGH